eukprot:GEMP01027749.1.p1 GENE.GEMP01027749.1~~GEMP01027749.1.p1  ORF type:complete len:693 (+),score=126.75 GEMP01027749.1:181-2259(+)
MSGSWHRYKHAVLRPINHWHAAQRSNFERRAPFAVAQSRHFFNLNSWSSSASWSKAPDLFGVKDLHAPQDFSRLAADAVKQARIDIQRLKTTKVGVVQGLDDISNNLCGIADAAELCRNVHPDNLWVQHGNEAVTMVAEFMSEVNLDHEIFDLLRTAPSEKNLELAVVHKHMKESMEHEGVGLPNEQKDRCLHLLDRELALSFQLSTPGPEPEIWIPKSALHEVQPDSLKGFRTRKGNSDTELLVSAQFAEAVSRVVGEPEARRTAYEAHLQEDPERRAMLLELLQTRQELAQIRGYENWNAYAQRDSILDGSAGIFLDDAWRTLEPKVEEEMDTLRKMKASINLGSALEPWDISFFLQYATEALKTPDSEASVPRLTYSQLLTGVSRICSQMLNVDFVQERGEEARCVWHPSVQKFSLRKDGQILGILYLDCFSRPGKKTQSAQFTLRGSKIVHGKRQIPSTALVCIMHPSAPLPSSVAMTFMHEIGHALHSLLSCTEMQHLSGTRGTVDFVEFPSHLFEYFATDPGAVMQYTPSQKPLEPRKAPFRHIDAAQQLFLAQVDHNFYSCPNSVLDDVNKVYEHVIGGLSPTAQLLTPRALTKFEHLIHYGGSYYCYLLNKAMAAHVWQEGFKNDPFGAAAGERLTVFFRNGSTRQHMQEIERLLPEGAPRLTYRGADPSKLRVSLDAMMNQLM